MHTANTMASAIEALGMSLPGSSSQDAVSIDKQEDCKKIGNAINNLLEKISSLRHHDERGFRKCYPCCNRLGWINQCRPHLLAMASVEIPLNIDDFEEIGKTSPLLVDQGPQDISLCLS